MHNSDALIIIFFYRNSDKVLGEWGADIELGFAFGFIVLLKRVQFELLTPNPKPGVLMLLRPVKISIF